MDPSRELKREPMIEEDFTDLAEEHADASFSLKEFMLQEKAIINGSSAKIIIDLGASINTELTEIVDSPLVDQFQLEQGKISLERKGWGPQQQNLLCDDLDQSTKSLMSHKN